MRDIDGLVGVVFAPGTTVKRHGHDALARLRAVAPELLDEMVEVRS